MKTMKKRTLLTLGAVTGALVLAGAAIAAGPPASAPRLGQQAQAAHAYGFGHGLNAGAVAARAAANYIGISRTALAAARHDGLSLAQIAVENGKTAAGLQKAVVAALQTRLDAAVAAGKVTQARADRMLTQFKARVQTMLERTASGPFAGPGNGQGYGQGNGPRSGSGPGSGLGLGPCGGANS